MQSPKPGSMPTWDTFLLDTTKDLLDCVTNRLIAPLPDLLIRTYSKIGPKFFGDPQIIIAAGIDPYLLILNTPN